MPEGEHEDDLPRCPYLPTPTVPLRAEAMRPFRKVRDAGFYEAALLYAHSLWLQGFPARAILLLNRAMGCALTGDEEVLSRWPLPYEAMAWILVSHHDDQFIGNPRRHWQHLATRMSDGPLKELRVWRAWACWKIGCVALPEMPADELQIESEDIREPETAEIREKLAAIGFSGELAVWSRALRLIVR